MKLKVPISPQESEDFILAVKLLSEKYPQGPTRGDIFRFLFPRINSTQKNGKNRTEYLRIGSIADLLIRAGKIKGEYCNGPGKRAILRFKVAEPNNDGSTLGVQFDVPPQPPQAPKAQEALPLFFNSGEQELRQTLSHTIEALETLQENIPKILPLLLDIDRDFDRYKKVREVLQGVKQLTENRI
jgi:hypothetical protein